MSGRPIELVTLLGSLWIVTPEFCTALNDGVDE